jgi:hypothetical protein
MPLQPPTPPTRYLLTSAVIPSPGGYRYQLLSPEEARVWLTRVPWVSRVGYLETARYIERTLGVRCLLSGCTVSAGPGGHAPRLLHAQPELDSLQPTPVSVLAQVNIRLLIE